MKKYVFGLFFLVFGLTALGHEYVLLAYKYIVKEGDVLELHLFVADGFNAELERPFQRRITKSFQLITSKDTTDLLPELQDGDLPILEREVDFKGLGMLTMERDYATNILDNSAFIDYLKEDNIEGITIDTVNKTEQREKYTRYLKCLVQSEPLASDDVYKAQVGHALEFVLLNNPYELEEGDWLNVQVLFKGKALPNKVITARNRLGNKNTLHQYAKTNEAGTCTFKIERNGDWFIHATQMIPSKDQDADWESFWATFSFGIYPR